MKNVVVELVVVNRDTKTGVLAEEKIDINILYYQS